MKSHSIAAALILAALAVTAAQTPSNSAQSRVFDTNTKQRIRVVTVATGLVHPTCIAFLPDGRTMLVAERGGGLRIIRDGVLDPQPVWQAPASPAPAPPQEGGQDRLLHGVVVHPQFAQNRLVYVSHTKWGERVKLGERGHTLAISRGRLEGGMLVDVREIFVADAWDTGGTLAGRLLFGPDTMLYLTIGDRDRLCCIIGKDDNSLRMKAQYLDNHVGKTLRLKDDGTVPPDNPFVGKPGAKPEIYTYGHRNGYGLAFHPETGELWQAEIGPMGGDEINILIPGRNYGWPLVSMGRNYTGTLVSEEPWFRRGMENPRMFWVPSINPSSIVFYSGDKFPGWKGSLFVGTLNGNPRRLLRVSFDSTRAQAEGRESLLTQLDVRMRDVQQGPDGCLYIATEVALAGPTADGTILRIEPAE